MNLPTPFIFTINRLSGNIARENGIIQTDVFSISDTEILKKAYYNLMTNQEFIEKFGSEVKHGNLTELYGAYLYQKSKNEINKGNSVPPTSSNSNKKGSNDLSKIDSDEEFLAEFNKKYKH